MARGGFYSVDSLNGVHVLLVGHEPAAREVLASILRYCGALVTPAATAVDALDVMRQVKADVLVTEAVLSVADAGSLIRQVRARKPEDGGVVPAVALVPPSEAATVDQMRSAGFDAVMVLPLDPWALCRIIASLVNVA
jgi:CheY-like chemotaxis protein